MKKQSTTLLFLLIFIMSQHVPLFSAGSTESVDLTLKIYNESQLLFDDFNSHYWWRDGGDSATLTWTNFSSRACMKIKTVNDTGDNYTLFRTDHYFNYENWSSSPKITNVRCDVYLASGDTGIKLKIEPKTNENASVEAIYHTESLSTGSWVTVNWKLNHSLKYSKIGKLIILVDYLNGGTGTVYIDNLRLVDTANNEYAWDDFADKSLKWKYADFSDATNYSPLGWHGACETVTHNNVDGPSTNEGCLFMQWNAALRAVENFAKVNCEDGSFNVEGFTQIEARVRCTSTAANIKLGFDDNNAHSLESSTKNVAAANTWETITWDLPTGTFDWNVLKNLAVIVTTDTVSAGKIYIDHIKFK